MKTKQFLVVAMASVVFSLITTSCQKSMVEKEQNTVQPNTAQTDDLLEYNNCLITHYEDDYNPGYTIDFSYNKYRQPDSVTVNFFGTRYEAAQYDKFGRLAKVTFPYSTVQDYEAFIYHGSLLPAKLLYIVPNYQDYGQTDSINVVVYFRYNYKGEMIEMKQSNIWYPGYDITYNYTYDIKGNIKSIIHTPESGTPYTEYLFNSYDNKPNFMTGSKWIRYLLFFQGFDPFSQLLFSRNNAKDWTWFNAFGINGANEIFTSTFNYNSEGFANTVNLNVVDSVLGNYNNTRNAVFTCDNFTNIPNLISSGRASTPLNMFKQFRNRLPSPYYNRN